MSDNNVECTKASVNSVFVVGEFYKASVDFMYVEEKDTQIPWALNDDLKVRRDYYNEDSEVLAVFKKV